MKTKVKWVGACPTNPLLVRSPTLTGVHIATTELKGRTCHYYTVADMNLLYLRANNSRHDPPTVQETRY